MRKLIIVTLVLLIVPSIAHAARVGNLIVGNGTNDISMTGSTIVFSGSAGISMPHLMQSDSTDQAIISATTAQTITFNTDVHHKGILRTSSSRFTIQQAGSYLITFSGVTKGATNEYIAAWMRVNGNDVADSNTLYQYKSNNATAVIAVGFLYHFVAGDYFEFWTWGSSASDSWDATAAVAHNPGVTPARPACPSIIMTCNYVGGD